MISQYAVNPTTLHFKDNIHQKLSELLKHIDPKAQLTALNMQATLMRSHIIILLNQHLKLDAHITENLSLACELINLAMNAHNLVHNNQQQNPHNDILLLGGDYLYSQAFAALINLQNPIILQNFVTEAEYMAECEILLQTKKPLSLAEQQQILLNKKYALFKALSASYRELMPHDITLQLTQQIILKLSALYLKNQAKMRCSQFELATLHKEITQQISLLSNASYSSCYLRELSQLANEYSTT